MTRLGYICEPQLQDASPRRRRRNGWASLRWRTPGSLFRMTISQPLRLRSPKAHQPCPCWANSSSVLITKLIPKAAPIGTSPHVSQLGYCVGESGCIGASMHSEYIPQGGVHSTNAALTSHAPMSSSTIEQPDNARTSESPATNMGE